MGRGFDWILLYLIYQSLFDYCAGPYTVPPYPEYPYPVLSVYGYFLFLCILLITGCSDKKSSGGKGVSTANSVDKVINNQINNENSKTETAESEEPSVNDESN